MKRFILIFVFMLAVMASYGQRYASVFVVPADTTPFGKVLPSGTVIVDQEKHATWITTATSTSVMTLLTATVVPMLADSSSTGLWAITSGVIVPYLANIHVQINHLVTDTGFFVDGARVFSFDSANNVLVVGGRSFGSTYWPTGGSVFGFGYDACMNSTGSGLIGLGSDALWLSTCSQSIGIGENAGGYGCSADSSIFIGTNAGLASTGKNSIHMGFLSGSGNSGERVISLGDSSGYNNTLDDWMFVGVGDTSTAPWCIKLKDDKHTRINGKLMVPVINGSTDTVYDSEGSSISGSSGSSIYYVSSGAGEKASIINSLNCKIDSSNSVVINSEFCEVHYNPTMDVGYTNSIFNGFRSKLQGYDYSSIITSKSSLMDGLGGDANVIFGGEGHLLSGGQSNAVIQGGKNDTIINSDNSGVYNSKDSKIKDVNYNSLLSAIISSDACLIDSAGGAVVGAKNSIIQYEDAVTGFGYYDFIGGGSADTMYAADMSVVLGGNNNAIKNAQYCGMIGGSGNKLGYFSVSRPAILNSVIIGGTGINATKSNTAYAQELNVSDTLFHNKIYTRNYSDTLAYGDSILLCAGVMAPNVWVSVDTIGIPTGKADIVIGSNGALAQVYTPYGCIVVGALTAGKICIRKWGTSVYIRNNRWKHQRITYQIQTL